MKPAAARNKKGRGALCNLPLLLLIAAIQFLVIYSPTLDRYMVMITSGMHCISVGPIQLLARTRSTLSY
jgi:hypothetical protein